MRLSFRRFREVVRPHTKPQLLFLAGLLVVSATLYAAYVRSESKSSDHAPNPGSRATRVTSAPSPPPFTGAKYEPVNGCYLGAYIDLDPLLNRTILADGRRHKDPIEFEQIVGKPHSIYFFYMGYGKPFPKRWVHTLVSMGKFVHIALEPNQGLDAVQDGDYLRTLADEMGTSGAKIFLRFASEMNGDWVNYWGNPRKYIEKWQLVYRTMAQRAPNVAMVWCPYAFPMSKALPYYPGDEYVDWVGVNFYNVTHFNQNPLSPARHVRPLDMLYDAYRLFARRKPIMICEYGATHFSALENRDDAQFAIQCIEELYRAILTTHRRVKAINYFNTNNLHVTHRRNNDYSLTSSPEVLEAYRQVIASDLFLGTQPDGDLPPAD